MPIRSHIDTQAVAKQLFTLLPAETVQDGGVTEGKGPSLQGNEREDAISVLNRCRHLVKQHLKPGLACGCSPTTSAKVPYHCRGLIEAYRSYAVDGVTPSRDSAGFGQKSIHQNRFVTVAKDDKRHGTSVEITCLPSANR